MSKRELVELARPLLATAGARWLLCLSGGIDSRVLFEICRRVAPLLSAELVTLHIDHNMRPSSAADASFCEALARDHDIHHESISLQITPRASIQDAARRQRWASIADTARRLDIQTVLTAHHADDAIETFLLNATRGAGSAGLSSLGREQREVPWAEDLTLVRPLMKVRRAEIEAYAVANNLTWVEDPTNATDHYSRNKIRHAIAPELESRFGMTGVLATIENLRREAMFIKECARRAHDEARLTPSFLTSAALDTQKLMMQDEVISTHIIRASLDQIGAPIWSRRHVDELLGALRRTTACRLTFPGVVAEITPARVELHRTRGRGTRALDGRQAHSIELPLPQPGEVIESGWFHATLSASVVHIEQLEGKIEESRWRAMFDVDELDRQLILRAITPQDKLQTGKAQRRSAKKLVRDAAVPTFQRWCWPCICATHELLWVPGVRRSTHAQVTASTRRILIIEHVNRDELVHEGLLK